VRTKVRHGLIGAGIALGVVIAVGAVRGAIYGNGDDYALRLKGFDGAFLGAILFAVFGGLPAILIGAGAGIAVGWHRNRGALPSRSPQDAEPGAAADRGRR
jgi:hypothetical protein